MRSDGLGAWCLVTAAVDGHPSALACRGARLASVARSGRKLPGMRKWRCRAMIRTRQHLAARRPGLDGRTGGAEPGMDNDYVWQQVKSLRGHSRQPHNDQLWLPPAPLWTLCLLQFATIISIPKGHFELVPQR